MGGPAILGSEFGRPVGDGQFVRGAGDGDDAPMVQPVVIGAYEHEVVQFGRATVFPVPDVMCM